MFQKILIDYNANLYVEDIKKNNCLHYAAQNENRQLIKYIIEVDAEKEILVQEINFKGKTPAKISNLKMIKNLFNTPWNQIKINDKFDVQKLLSVDE